MSIMRKEIEIETDDRALMIAEPHAEAALFEGAVGSHTAVQLNKMFRDPRVLEPAERIDIVAQLRKAVDRRPEVAELRVLLGMALCVDLQAQEAMEQLRQAVEQAPDSFIAHL